MSDVNSVLQWIVTGGAVIIAAWVASWALEDLAWWAKQSSKAKKTMILGVSLFVALGATYLVNLPAETMEKLMPYLTTILFTVLAWLSTQVAHKNDVE